MDIAQIATRLGPFLAEPLHERQLEQISIYIDLLKRWNARINLTAIRKEEEIITRHFGESLFLARHVFPDMNMNRNASPTPLYVIDIGSGAGFPALPLKIWAPHITLTMIESNQKKAAFLREVTRALTLTDVNVSTGRAEVAAANPAIPRSDRVTLRAVERFATILPQAIALVAPNGRLALLIGKSQLDTLTPSLNIAWDPPVDIPNSHSRVLSIGVHWQSGTQTSL
jgi:16S rRNA (guanine527-N7)-methyltransferase